MGLQSAFGCARVLKGKGAAAQAVRALLTRMRQELSPDELPPPGACLIPRNTLGGTPFMAGLWSSQHAEQEFNLGAPTFVPQELCPDKQILPGGLCHHGASDHQTISICCDGDYALRSLCTQKVCVC